MNETQEKDAAAVDRLHRRWYHVLYLIAWPLVKLLYPFRAYGREKIPEGAVILCAPHTGYIDPVLVSMAMGRKYYVRHMAKAELIRSPLIGFLMQKIGSVFVRRGESDIEAFKKCLRLLKAGEKLMIFPEGTRVHDAEMGPLKPGALRMAQRLRVPVQPVYLTREKKLFRRNDVVFGEPYMVDADRNADMDALCDDLRERILALQPR